MFVDTKMSHYHLLIYLQLFPNHKNYPPTGFKKMTL